MSNPAPENGHAAGTDMLALLSNPQIMSILIQQLLPQPQSPLPAQNIGIRPLLTQSVQNPPFTTTAVPPLQSMNGALQLLAYLQNITSQQMSSAPQEKASEIEPSLLNDVAVATRLRDARRNGRSYLAAIETVVMTHGHTKVDWMAYTIKRLDIIYDLIDMEPMAHAMSSTAKKSLIGPAGRINGEEASTTLAKASTHSSSTKTTSIGRGDSSRIHKRARRSSPESSDSSDSSSVPEPEQRLRHNPDYVVKQVGKRKKIVKRLQGRLVKRPLPPPSDAPAAKSHASSNLRQNYLDTDEMGTWGAMVTSGDLNAMAQWIVTRFNGNEARGGWEEFALMYPQRSLAAWRETYRRRKEEIHRRAKSISANGDPRDGDKHGHEQD